MSLEPRSQPGPLRVSRFIALALDDLVRIPGTGIGIGLDGVLGLIPGVGDAGTTAVAALLMADAIRNRVPLPVLARMGLNLGLDALIGMIPVIGDIGDFAHRANRRTDDRGLSGSRYRRQAGRL